MEEYKLIKNTPYAISNLGNIKNTKTNRLIRPHKSKVKYLAVRLYYRDENNNRTKKTFSVSRLMYKAFINDDITFHDKVKHKDNNPLNCNVDNLYIKTFKNNTPLK